jgi:hypothetical protein
VVERGRACGRAWQSVAERGRAWQSVAERGRAWQSVVERGTAEGVANVVGSK